MPLCMLMALSHGVGGAAAAAASPGLPAEEDPLVLVTDFVPDAVLDVRYATSRNFLRRAVYPFPVVYLRQSTARKLAVAARILKRRRYRLLIFDGYRPLSVQKKMWKAFPDPRFVADPAVGSWHNKGGAVDLALADAEGRPLEMPTEFDDFKAAGSSRPNRRARRHHAMLWGAMKAAGFKPIKEEWWHYFDPATADYPLLDLGFEKLGPRGRR